VKSRFSIVISLSLIILSFLFNSLLYPGIDQTQQRRKVKAPEFPTGLTWINSEEKLSLEKFKGHIILFDFWTYSSINCLHILPDLEYLQEKYKDEPFVILGVHSGKFYNEQDAENVRSAVVRYHITYPVVVDEKRAIWRQYGAKAWPTFILLDSEGYGLVVLTGEGRRQVLDQLIADALQQGAKNKTLVNKTYSFKPPLIQTSLLSFPTKLALDSTANILYIADSGHNQIIAAKLQSPDTATILQRIGSGKKEFKNGDYSNAAFANPQGLTFHQSTLYVADTDNHAIRAVDLTQKKVYTLNGDGKYGDFGQPNSPTDLVFYDNTLYITMAGNNQLWKLDIAKKKLTLFVGNGYVNMIDGSALGASLAQPSCITLDEKTRRFYFVDSESSALRCYSLPDNEVKTLIGQGLFKYGFGEGKFAEAALQNPLGIFYSTGKIYIADTFNHALRVADLEKGELRTLVSQINNSKTNINIEGTATIALSLWEPNGLLVVNDTIYIADTNNHQIRIYNMVTKKLDTLKITEED